MQRGDGRARRRLDGVGDDEHGARLAVPADDDGGAALASAARRAASSAPGARPRTAPAGRRRRRARRRSPSTPSPAWLTKRLDGSRTSSAAAAMARPIGCSEPRSSAAGQPQRVRVAGDVDAGASCPVVTVPVLSSTTVSTRRVDSRTSGPLMSRPSCAPRPVPTISAVGVARPSAHGQAMISTATAAVNAKVAASPVAEPEAERGDGERDHDRDEDAGDAVGEPLDGRLARLRVLDEPRDLRQRGVLADARGAHDEPAAGVDGRARDVVARRDLDRDRLAGEQAHVDRRACRPRRRRPWPPSRPAGRRSGRRPRAARSRQALGRRPRRASSRPWRRARAARAGRRRRGAWRAPRSSGRRG